MNFVHYPGGGPGVCVHHSVNILAEIAQLGLCENLCHLKVSSKTTINSVLQTVDGKIYICIRSSTQPFLPGIFILDLMT